MEKSENGSEAEKIAIAAVNTIAATSLILSAACAAGLAAGESAFHYSTLGKATLCGFAAAIIAGLGSAFLYRHLYRRVGSFAALSGLLAIPLYYAPELTLSVIATAVGGLAILLSVRCVNRRDDPRSGSAPGPPADSK